jgi:hypothetical protein
MECRCLTKCDQEPSKKETFCKTHTLVGILHRNGKKNRGLGKNSYGTAWDPSVCFCTHGTELSVLMKSEKFA